LVCIVVALVGPDAATAGAPITANGTITCNRATGTMTFAPPLTNGGTSAEVVTMAVHETRCSTSGNTNLPHGKITGHLTVTADGQNSCTVLNTLTGWSGTSTWKDTRAPVNPTTLETGAHFGTGPGGVISPEMPKPHHLSDSFAMDSAITSYGQFNLTVTSTQFSTQCTASGVVTLRIPSGSTWL
jgi:hypothetical protein